MKNTLLRENTDIAYWRNQFEERANQKATKMPAINDRLENTNLKNYYVDFAAIAEAILQFKDQPFTLEKFRFWIDIYNSPRLTLDVDMVYRKMVFKCSRQVGKSVACGALASTLSITRKSFNTIICQPTDKQLGIFSAEILKRFNLDSVVTDYWYRDPRKTVRQVKNVGYTTGSRILLSNIYNSVLSSRGASGDCIIIDEVQDIPEGHIVVVEKSSARSQYKIMIYSGTPKEPQNLLQKKWEKSTQNEWMVPCMSCGHWNGPLGGDGSDKKIKNIGKNGLICDKCKKRIYPEDGEWVSAFPGKEIDGYHINELMVEKDKSEWASLLYDLEDNPEVKVWNEILGISYSGEAFPIPQELVLKRCDPLLSLVDSEAKALAIKSEYMFAGLDWAGETSVDRDKDRIKSYTILNIAKYDPNIGKMMVVFVRRYYDLPDFDSDSPNEVLRDILYWLNLFNVKTIGCDYGVGHKENQRIAHELINGLQRVMEIQYLNIDANYFEYRATANKWIVRRSYLIEFFIESLQLGDIVLPRREDTSEYIEDLTGTYKYFDANKRVTYGKKNNDDWLHALMYTMAACYYYMGNPKFVYKMVQ
jgi:hypothetical protein